MDRVAVLIDAGYLFAQGSIALTGHKASRSLTYVKHPAVISRLQQVAHEKSGGLQLLGPMPNNAGLH